MGSGAALTALGHQLRYLRQSAGMTLVEAARQLRATKGHLSNIERGRDRPGLAIVAFYEERFNGDGQAFGLYVESVTSWRPRQRQPIASRPRYPIPGDGSTFVADITVPDGTIMPPFFIFQKVWRVRNSGTVPWIGRWLVREGVPGGYGVPRSPYRVPIPDTQPGEEVDLVVPVQAQALEGSSQAHWKMKDADGWEYFPDRYPAGIVLSIVVRAGAPAPEIRRRD